MNYETWIAQNYPTKESAMLQCATATGKMIEQFPELKQIRGHAMVGIQLRPHWWCKSPDGTIVDPTAHQWEDRPVFYQPLPDDAEEPHGKCYHCGELLFRSHGADSYFCQDCKS